MTSRPCSASWTCSCRWFPEVGIPGRGGAERRGAAPLRHVGTRLLRQGQGTSRTKRAGGPPLHGRRRRTASPGACVGVEGGTSRTKWTGGPPFHGRRRRTAPPGACVGVEGGTSRTKWTGGPPFHGRRRRTAPPGTCVGVEGGTSRAKRAGGPPFHGRLIPCPSPRPNPSTCPLRSGG